MARRRVLLLSHIDYDAYHHADGSPFFAPDEYDVTFVADRRHVARLRTGPLPPEIGETIATRLKDDTAVSTLLEALARTAECDYVVALQERLLLPAARFREALGLPGPGVAQTLLLRDKIAMKRHFAAHGVRVPDHIEIREPRDASAHLARHGRIVIKPVDGSGSFDINVISDRQQLAALHRRGLRGPHRYEAEEFVDGRQFHIDSIVRAGTPLATSVSQYLDSHESFPLGGQIRSHTLDPGPERRRLTEFNAKVLSCLPRFDGVTHLEAFLDPDGEPVFCEIAGRPGGAGIVTTFQHAHGASLLLAGVLPQIGRPVPDPAPPGTVQRTAPGAAPRTQEVPSTGWSLIYPPALGRFQSYDSLPSAPWLLQLTTPLTPGDLVTASRRSTDVLATIAVSGVDSREVVAHLDGAQAEITATIVQDPIAGGAERFEPLTFASAGRDAYEVDPD
ncbi:ATP-grasp domain-containing protein [Catenulispora rubra]|uniref:ATP-grasp domain-containing protein n=1 Tax=Catenulispora rubra TaxID=280293 RepID=UPI0018926E03|nr:ATP-grasp domain-containing protein [Catenulispora rubra]